MAIRITKALSTAAHWVDSNRKFTLSLLGNVALGGMAVHFRRESKTKPTLYGAVQDFKTCKDQADLGPWAQTNTVSIPSKPVPLMTLKRALQETPCDHFLILSSRDPHQSPDGAIVSMMVSMLSGNPDFNAYTEFKTRIYALRQQLIDSKKVTHDADFVVRHEGTDGYNYALVAWPKSQKMT